MKLEDFDFSDANGHIDVNLKSNLFKGNEKLSDCIKIAIDNKCFFVSWDKQSAIISNKINKFISFIINDKKGYKKIKKINNRI